MIFDSHMHTKFSADSTMLIEDVVKKSKEYNMGVIITEHIDLDQPADIGFSYDVNQYFKEYEKYRDSSVLLGTEFGLALSTIEENTLIATKNPYDYIIGSIHSVYNSDIYSEFGKSNLSKEDKFNKYFDCMIECIKTCDYFDSLGHIDYLCRYVDYNNKEIVLPDFKDKLELVFKSLISKDKVLELNTRRLYLESTRKSLFDIYKFYKELGGKYVTIGSDAHNPKDIFVNFDFATNFIDNLNLKGIYYKERKPEFF